MKHPKMHVVAGVLVLATAPAPAVAQFAYTEPLTAASAPAPGLPDVPKVERAASHVPDPLLTEPGTLVALRSIYVADPAAPWFMDWYGEKLAQEAPFLSADIEVASPDDIVASLPEAPYAVAVMPASEFAGVATGADLASAQSGFRVCAAFLTHADSPIVGLGDVHTLPGRVNIAATPDTIGIARIVFGAYNAADRVELVEASAEAAVLGVANGDLALAVTRASEGKALDLAGSGGDVRVLPLTPSIIQAGEENNLVPGGVSKSLVEAFAPPLRTPTLCDDILIVAFSAAHYRPERLARGGAAGTARPEGPEFETNIFARSFEALNQLHILLWGEGDEPAR